MVFTLRHKHRSAIGHTIGRRLHTHKRLRPKNQVRNCSSVPVPCYGISSIESSVALISRYSKIVRRIDISILRKLLGCESQLTRAR